MLIGPIILWPTKNWCISRTKSSSRSLCSWM